MATASEHEQLLGAGALLLICAGCGAWMLLQPRLPDVAELPALQLDADAVATTIAGDRREAARAPRGPEADRVDALLLQQGAAEAAVLEDPALQAQRLSRSRRALAALLAAAGPEAPRRMRAMAVERLERALGPGLDPELTRQVLGSFPTLLVEAGITRGGLLVAPHFVLRTIYKARWNMCFGLAPEHDLAAVEAQALFGWRALHDRRLAAPLKLAALDQYQAHGGRHAPLARGVLHYAQVDFAAAAAVFEGAEQSAPGPRLRNYLARSRGALEHPRHGPANGALDSAGAIP
ncbi:MAG: hypothetical protein OEZ06_19725 [Myxococcales bacterium]|nr:hypothetical protein [Myxococcales bacterium]